MTFQHMKVETAKRSHERAMEQYVNRVETTSEEREERKRRTTRIIDGLPIHVRLGELCEAIRKTHRDVKFAVHRNGKSIWVDGEPVISEVWAYFDGDDYAFMRLGFADYSVRNGDGSKYGVYSRLIRNQKFGEDREQHHMAMAETLERALKNVKANMRRYLPREIAAMSIGDFQSKVSTAGWNAASEHRHAFEDVVHNNAFMSEMRSLVMNNHQFNDPLFGEKVRIMVTKHDEKEELANAAHHGYNVQVREFMGEQVFDVIVVYDVKRASGNIVSEHKSYKAHELDSVDESIVAKMSALSMLENGAFVDGLGLKISDRNYWVLK